MRIGLVSRAYPPHPIGHGIATYTRELGRGLAALGHEVHVFTESRQPLRHEVPRLTLHGVTAGILPVVPGRPITDRQVRWSIAVARRVLALTDAGLALDVVESPNWEAEGAALRRTRRVPMVVRLHSPLAAVSAAEGRAMSPDLATATLLERWVVATADAVTGSTAGVLETVRTTMGIDPDRTGRYARIPLGVPPPPPAPTRDDGPPRLLFVGRLEPRKGIQTLLAVLPALLDAHRALRADIVGADVPLGAAGDTFRRRFERQHALAPWRRRCRFHGQVDDAALAAFYARSSFLVAPSLYESFGLVFLEAMRYGKPVIGCCTGGVPEVVRDGETGLLVPPDDPPALAAAINRLVADAALRRALGETAHRVVATEFSAARMVERTAVFYAEVIAGAAGPSGARGGDRGSTLVAAGATP
jgi:hypothetical protein